MSQHDILAIAAFSAFGVAALPVARLRRATLWVVYMAAALALTGGVAAAAVMQFAPRVVPPDVRAGVDPWAALVSRGAPAAAGYEWLVTAALAVLAGLPALAVLDFARRLTGCSAALDRVSGEVRAMARVMAARVPATRGAAPPPATPPIPPAPTVPHPTPGHRPPLLADLLFPDAHPTR